MIVQRRHIDAARSELCGDRRNLVHCQDEVTHHHGPFAHFLESQPAAERKAGLQLDPVQSDFEIGARQAHAVDATQRRRAAFPKGLADLRLPVIGGNGKTGRCS
jgi:hypothetical protein